jgi:hypothetical protein
VNSLKIIQIEDNEIKPVNLVKEFNTMALIKKLMNTCDVQFSCHIDLQSFREWKDVESMMER